MTDVAASTDAPVEGKEAPPARPASPKSDATLSPAMRQYQQFKSQYPGYVLFFRMGDFYEMFWEDAQLAAKTLGVPVEHLVEIAHPVEQQHVGVLRLEGEVLLHHRGVGGRAVQHWKRKGGADSRPLQFYCGRLTGP